MRVRLRYEPALLQHMAGCFASVRFGALFSGWFTGSLGESHSIVRYLAQMLGCIQGRGNEMVTLCHIASANMIRILFVSQSQTSNIQIHSTDST